uniref:PDZ domain-containing protein n=1 Tax=Macrostomum lignano TaxID=282301 RepID=A0A1I8JBI1_9PLAT
MNVPENQKPRLCMLRKWDDFAGYGFNLHAEKGKTGQFIGKVDPLSPAALGGLRANDIVIEVNGINVEDASHATVVSRVKAQPGRVDLFVCSPQSLRRFRQAGLQLSSAVPGVVRCVTPDRRPVEASMSAEKDSGNADCAAASDSASQQESQPQSLRAAPLPQKSAPSQLPPPAAPTTGADPLGNVSLADMRARIGQNRRNQVKMSAVSFSEKYNVFQSL